MRTVSVVAYNRPMYLSECFLGLAVALNNVPGKFDHVVFSVDPGDIGVQGEAKTFAKFLSENLGVGAEVCINRERLGAAGNQLMANRRAFETLGSDLNVSLEDDAVVTPDALKLILWWGERQQHEFPDSCLFGLSNHRDFGKGQNPKIPEDDPSMVVESFHIPSPFAWATNSQNWNMISRRWNFKVVPPTGWDFSLSMSMRLDRRVAMHPVLSRCRNIGRVGGTNETPETFDRTQVGLIYSDGSYSGDYRLVACCDRGDLEKLDGWMIPEWEKEVGHKGSARR